MPGTTMTGSPVSMMNAFLGEPQGDETEEKVIAAKDGIVEKVNKTLRTGDGRQLLREQVYEA